MICLNSVMELTTRAMTMFLQVCISTPVVNSCEVVRITGVIVSSSWKRLRWPRPMSPSIGGYPADIIRILLHQVGIEVVQGPAHLVGVFLIHAEDDGLGKAVGLLEEVGEMSGDGLGAGSQGDDPLKVFGRDIPHRESPGHSGPVPRHRGASRRHPGGDNPMHPVGGQKAVLNALPQAVSIDGIAKV